MTNGIKLQLPAADIQRVGLLKLVLPAFAALVALVVSAPAAASEQFADMNVRNPTLKVDGKGRALVEYTTERGLRRHVLVFSGINANPPSQTVPQVRFTYDFSGGLSSKGRALWKTFRNACRRYDGPALAYRVSACKAPDGSYWALQSWQRRLPLLGFDPWLPIHDDYELHLSHWSGPLPVLEVYRNWTHGLQFEGLFGRLTYRGQPVFGFSSSREGSPRDRYSRNVYIDTFNSVYGRGWRRESGILTHGTTGTFCHSFVPQRPFPGYPHQQTRPAAPGERYRVTVMGPGVTPVVSWEDAGLGRFNAANPAHHAFEESANGIFDRVMAGDRICANER
jgi:hypothetical protein